MKTTKVWIAAISIILTMTMAGCKQGSDGPASPSLSALAVTPADPVISAGDTRKFTATGTYSDATTRDMTSSVIWTSSDPAVATVSAAGIAEAVAAGTAVITAASGNVSGTVTLKVRDIAAESPFGFHPASVTKFGYDNRGFGDAQNIGVKWTREGVYAYWSLVQPLLSDPTYTFTLYDRQWSRVPAGMNILANIAPQPEGPIGENRCFDKSYLPKDEQKYIAFVKALVQRYSSDSYAAAGLAAPIKYWQVGNEPNPVKSDFAELQKITYTAIKEVCPDCKVVIGGVPGVPPANPYNDNFDDQYKPILKALGGQYVDIMDFHWFGAAKGDYRDAKPVYEHIRSALNEFGFPSDLPIWITEMGAYSGYPATGNFPEQTERQQALDYFKRFIYPLAFGVKKVFPAFGVMEGLEDTPEYNDDYFDHTGLIYDGLGAGDLGLGVKKLGYYTYKKMTEVLEGSDWSSIETIREDSDVFIYKLMKDGRPVYVAWWDYFNDGSYTPGKTIEVSFSGLTGSSASVTEALPKFNTGAEVTDYDAAFNTTTLAITDGTAVLTLGDSPVFVESPPLSLVKTVTLTTDAEGGSARPEVIATDNRVFAVYLGHITGGRTTKSFDVKVYDADLSSLVTSTTIVPPSPVYGAGTDIRIARDGNFLYAFYESSTVDTTYLHGAKYALNDSFDLVARADAITSSKPVFGMTEGDEVLNDPAPLVGPDSVFVATRLWSSITTTGSTVYRVREFSKTDLAKIREIELHLSGIADGRGRVASLLYADGAIYMALATTVSDAGASDANKFSDDGAQCDIIVVKMAPDWSFDPAADVKTVSNEPDDRENYITGLRTDGSSFYMTYKQAVGSPPSGEQRAVIKVFDGDFNLQHKEIVKKILWGGGEIRPSLEIFGNKIYSGQDNSPGIGSGNGQVYVYEIQ